jgi:hypothetical protein
MANLHVSDFALGLPILINRKIIILRKMQYLNTKLFSEIGGVNKPLLFS